MKIREIVAIGALCGLAGPCCYPQSKSRDITRADGFMNVCGPLNPSLGPGMKSLMEGARKQDIPVCDMYILGIFEGIQMYDVIAVQHSKIVVKPNDSICMTGAISPDHMRRDVVQYIQSHPALVASYPRLKAPQTPTSLAALLAFEQKYRCKKSGDRQ